MNLLLKEIQHNKLFWLLVFVPVDGSGPRPSILLLFSCSTS